MDIAVRAFGMLKTNCYLLDRHILIDPGDDVAGISAFLEEHCADVKAIVLTHGHFDHSAGCAALKKRTGAKLYIAEADRLMLENKHASLGSGLMRTPFEPVEPDGFLSEGEILLDGSMFTVLATPGHTPGSVCLIPAGERLIFSGDTLFNGCCGRTDFPGGSTAQMYASLKRLFSLEGEYTVYPGHYESGLLTQIRKEFSL